MKQNPIIMAVDDEPGVLKLLTNILKPEGYTVITSDNSRIALDLWEEHNPDLVILDIKMPGLDGLQLLDLIRKRSTVPVIMLTAKGDAVCDALGLGADDFMSKPFRKNELMARIKAKLRREDKRKGVL
ncbi:MAG: hypothetical protein A2158_05035 [Chloroflexi bacterium RBG_13_46_14]|nr:MAG: hypothetical protein A2158_05035 [Chloroflexi bacterium RBG_13_46_14]